jgi:DNA-binding response OmpR family regulator
VRIIAKLLLLSLEEDEEVVLNAVMSALGSFENKTQLKEEIGCEKLAFEGMEIDASERLVYRGEKEVNITFTEFEILYLLASSPGRVFSKEQIYELAWEEPYFGDYNIVMSHIRNIREKIEDNPSKPIYIQTVWGVGYRFNQKMV